MLVLTRKVGEVIRIGDEVTVQVLAIRGGQVRLGFAAPAEVRIFREEIFRSIEGQNRGARLPSEESLRDAAQAWEAYTHDKHG
jgi:carbon storage regulator